MYTLRAGKCRVSGAHSRCCTDRQIVSTLLPRHQMKTVKYFIMAHHSCEHFFLHFSLMNQTITWKKILTKIKSKKETSKTCKPSKYFQYTIKLWSSYNTLSCLYARLYGVKSGGDTAWDSSGLIDFVLFLVGESVLEGTAKITSIVYETQVYYS